MHLIEIQQTYAVSTNLNFDGYMSNVCICPLILLNQLQIISQQTSKNGNMLQKNKESYKKNPGDKTYK